MPSITFHQPSGAVDVVEVAEGASVMSAALAHSIDGIVGECGGQAMCATCHVYVRGGVDLPDISDDEEEMLECTAAEREERSRLGCQLLAGRDFAAVEVDVPTTQI